MASSRSRNRLNCFYCGVKSSTWQDGSVKHFECKNCLSINYVDRNGEIMDPPSDAFSLEPSPPPILRYARQVSEPVFDTFLALQTADQPFCVTCQKNQHMYQSFISNYEPDHMGTDPSRPFSPDRKFLAYKKEMQHRYPQVCVDCQRGVDDRIRKANRLAQADILRHRLDRTKTKHSAGRTRTWLEFFSSWGAVLYWTATGTQVLVCFLGLLRATLPRISKTCLPDSASTNNPLSETMYPLYLAATVSLMACSAEKALAAGEGLAANLPALGPLSIFLTVASFWWNPYFRNMIRGFDRHIHGFLDWYKYQAILLVTRVVFWTMMGKGQFSRADAASTMGAYVFMMAFTLLIARISRRSIQVDFRKLFPTVRGSEIEQSPIAPAAQTSMYNGSGLMDALNSATRERNADTWTPPDPTGRSGPVAHRVASPDVRRRQFSSSPISMPQSKISLAGMTEQEAVNHLLRGELPDHLHDEADDREMDWTPSGGSRFKDFNPKPRQPMLVSPPPAPLESKPFWYKVPPAPKNQTNRPFDPFKKPIFEAVSAEKKQNFFDSMTGRSATFGKSASQPPEDRREMNMAPTKFFPQQKFETTGLEDLMEKAFTIRSAETPKKPAPQRPNGVFDYESFGMPKTPAELRRRTSSIQDSLPTTIAQGQPRSWKIHIAYLAGLSLAFALWHDTFNNQRFETKQTALGIIVLITARAARLLTDNTVTQWAKNNAGLQTAVATTLGGLEAAFSAYIGMEIVASQSLGPALQSKGSGLIGGMLVQELWFLLF